MSDETITCLEMTSPDQVARGRPPPAPLELQEVGVSAAALLRSTYVRIFGPYRGGRLAWSEGRWEEELAHPGVRAWIATVDDEVAGLVELEAEPNGDVGIVVFGLVSEFVGRGFGGALLTLATQLAWNLTPRTSRVWVQTSSHDHPYAKANYERRGFRVFTDL
jgi:RimJ/RimL family protein N-acetyltransferase